MDYKAMAGQDWRFTALVIAGALIIGFLVGYWWGLSEGRDVCIHVIDQLVDMGLCSFPLA